MSNYATSMICDKCGTEFSVREPLTTCSKCGGLLEVNYDLTAMKAGIREISGDKKYPSMWRYRQFFPEVEEKNIVTLGEGCTPLVNWELRTCILKTIP